jgi:hypothetical protein
MRYIQAHPQLPADTPPTRARDGIRTHGFLLDKETLWQLNCTRLIGNSWGRWDSNPHGLLHVILNHARLPVPTLPQHLYYTTKPRVFQPPQG